MLVHIFGAKSSPCCANKALNKTAQDNEIRKSPTVMFVSSASQIDVLLQRYSSWSRLVKVMSWVLRFV